MVGLGRGGEEVWRFGSEGSWSLSNIYTSMVGPCPPGKRAKGRRGHCQAVGFSVAAGFSAWYRHGIRESVNGTSGNYSLRVPKLLLLLLRRHLRRHLLSGRGAASSNAEELPPLRPISPACSLKWSMASTAIVI